MVSESDIVLAQPAPDKALQARKTEIVLLCGLKMHFMVSISTLLANTC
jgi:hypothetical protein